ncbi:MAG: 23S rRNA (adenine(2503)-C(2))-methyltransferase RlmN [Pseudomonadota bacterium]
MNSQNITDVSLRQLKSAVLELGLKPFAADQLVSWLYKKKVTSFEDMTNLSLLARQVLKENYFIFRPKLVKICQAKDSTRKFVFQLADDAKIESVLIPATDERLTLCISTQVGCPMGCDFCRTAKMGFKRDLSQGEILAQILEVQKVCDQEDQIITNVVFMGMGEPFVNYEAVAGAVEIMLSERGMNFSKRRVTISTSGLIPQLTQFAKDYNVKLAVSLNATEDKTRSKLMPINKRYPIADIINFARKYTKNSRNYVTFEYVLIKDVNDSKEDMQRLSKLLKGIRAKVNLIAFNAFPGSSYKGPSEKRVLEFHKYLTEQGIQTNIRLSRGQDILAACGQLAG